MTGLIVLHFSATAPADWFELAEGAKKNAR